MIPTRTFPLTNYYRRIMRMGDAELAASDPVKGAQIYGINEVHAVEYRRRELERRI